eukprot:gnl/MRDRNA2_/MRDRNA2_101138_c0_seq1.p1 gnl/MRDRNA2_/MRDRNA2_101138_c0~~gnl/MRDRNA2_/MRDRNA2_101138_c0_seq1.p1  ORF type:complete len:731 (+),score=121.10 gnl/MRDRNA2_/MRDRNA2_101138_c0_seq1:87-2279(+)
MKLPLCTWPRLLVLSLAQGAPSERELASSTTPELYPIHPAAGLPFFVELKASPSASFLLSYQDRIRVVNAAVECGKSEGSGEYAIKSSENADALRGPLAADPFAVGEAGQSGDFQTSLRWGNPKEGMLRMMKSGDFRVCLCAGVGVACNSDAMFPLTVGTFTITGPSKLMDGTSDTLLPVAGQMFNLQVMGHGMTTNDRIRLVGGNIPCGSRMSGMNTEMLVSGRLMDVSSSGPVGIAGVTGDTASSQMWMSLILSAAGEYSVCWCSGFLRPSGFCKEPEDFEVVAGSFVTVGAIPNGIAIAATGTPVPSGKLPENITGSGMKVNIGSGFDLYVTGLNGLTENDRVRLVDSHVTCGNAGSSRNSLNLQGSDLTMAGDLNFHMDAEDAEDMQVSLHWKGLSISQVGSYRVCWCPALGHNCDANSEFMVDTGTFEVIDTSASGAWMLARDDECDDDSSWKSPYGEDCIWHLKNDPGCKKFRDMGQLKNCPSACHNCDGSKPLPSERKTTCTMTQLCECYSSCDPPAPCPVGNEAHTCRPEIVDGKQPYRHPDFLELEVAEGEGGVLEPILGVQVQGDPNSQHHVTEFKIQISSVEKPEEFEDIDGGKSYAANWDGRSPVRVLFTQGATPARRLRILPIGFAGSPAISAKLVHKRCKMESPPEEARTDECLALMCKSYCHKRLGCQGEYVQYCEMRKNIEVVGSKACEVDCSGAATQVVYLGLFVSAALLLFM